MSKIARPRRLLHSRGRKSYIRQGLSARCDWRRLAGRCERQRQADADDLGRARTAPSRSSIRPRCRTRSSCGRCARWPRSAHAIAAMQVRGAPLIGAAAAYGLWLAMRADASDGALAAARATLAATRPTAVNLRWALDEMRPAWRRCRPTRGRPRRAPPPARSPTRTSRSTAPSASTGTPLIRAAGARRGRRGAGAGAHPLQRRLARDRRLGHGAGAVSTRRTTRACRCTSGSTRRGRATRALR